MDSNNWISVKDKLPKHGETVLAVWQYKPYVRSEKSIVMASYNECRNSWFECSDDWEFSAEQITHWMPLPELPKD